VESNDSDFKAARCSPCLLNNLLTSCVFC